MMVSEARGRQKERSVLSEENLSKIRKFQEKFKEKINDDLNMPQALSVVWELLKSNIPSYDKYDLLMDFDQVLGLSLGREWGDKIKVSPKIKELMQKRDKLREERKWKEADEIRKEVLKMGYVLEDTEEETAVKKRRN